MAVQYAEDFIDRLHVIWGPGFLSPGGPEEVREIVRGLDLDGRSLLDIGCGTGGPASVLAGDKGARVTCLDVEPQLIERARRTAEAAGVADSMTFCLVEPGPLPFDAECFDVVFSKDALIHIADKRALYAEVLRVLKPGGVFAASDWLAGAGAMDDPAFRRYVDLGHLKFTMATAEETAAIMRETGFADVATVDRNAWYAEVSAREAAAIAGPLREQVIAVSDLQTYERWRDGRKALADATAHGSLRPTHLRGTKPRSQSL
ncbi:MAG: class I SAM-dependent methyltransferase [Kiloniellaceae bacterium]